MKINSNPCQKRKTKVLPYGLFSLLDDHVVQTTPYTIVPATNDYNLTIFNSAKAVIHAKPALSKGSNV